MGLRNNADDVSDRGSLARSAGASSVATLGDKNLRKQKLAVWYKLGFMISFPLIALICLASTLVVSEVQNSVEAKLMSRKATTAGKIHKTLKAVLKERGLTSIFLSSNKTLERDNLFLSRETLDSYVIEYDEYILSYLDELTHDDMILVSMLSGLFHDIEYERELVDGGSVGTQEAVQYYSRVVTFGNELVRDMIRLPESRKYTVLFSTTSAWMYAEDWTGKMRDDFATELAVGVVTNTGLQKLAANLAVRDDFKKLARSISNYHGIELAEELSSSDEYTAVVSLTGFYLTQGPVSGFDTQKAEDWFNVQNAYVEKTYDTVKELLADLEVVASDDLTGAVTRETIAMVFVFLCTGLALGLAFLTAGSVAKPFVRLSKIKSQLTAETINIATTNDAVGRFVPFELLEILKVQDVTELTLGHSVSARLSVLFGDIVAFTTLSTTLGPDEVFKFINAWLGGLIPIIQKEGGIVDKFLGDGIMAFFLQSAKCVTAGVKIFDWAHEVNRVRAMSGGLPLAFGLGANQGEVSVGTIGSVGRMETTSTSEAVDVGNKVEASTRHFKSCFMVTGNVVHSLGTQHGFSFRSTGTIKMQKKANIPLYECLNAVDSDIERQAKEDSSQFFKEGVEAFEAGDFDTCEARMDMCLKRYSEDGGAQFYKRELEKARAALSSEGAKTKRSPTHK